MRRLCFLAGGALLAWLWQHYSFWAVFGWAYAAASLVLIVICFTHNRRGERDVPVAAVPPMQATQLEFESNQ